MNNVCLVGRLTRDPELRSNASGVKSCRFTVAVDRGLSKKDRDTGKQSADFISCVAFSNSADFVNNYFKKGSMIGINGRIQTGSYQAQDGTTRYTTDVVANNISFVGGKNDSTGSTEYADQMPDYSRGDQAPQTTDVGEDPFKDFGSEVVLSDDDLPF